MAILIENIGELVTMSGLAQSPSPSPRREDLGLKSGAWLLVADGKVKALGEGSCPEAVLAKQGETERIDAKGGLVLPGLVDSHTHAIYGGSRSREFCRRLEGASYQEIAAEGGGIVSTVQATRQATHSELAESLSARLDMFLMRGVTTLEVKSGYGLSVAEELRMLEVVSHVAANSPMSVTATCLALHAAPLEGSKAAYIDQVCQELIPRVADGSLARYVDVFVEEGYYDRHEAQPYFAAAQAAGLGIRVHADEFSHGWGAREAARWGAASADHLQYTQAGDIKLMAEAQTVATLLPGTALYTRIPYTDAREFMDGGCEVALASDFNPGSSPFADLSFVATLGAIHCHMSAVEALAAVTIVPARSLGLAACKGHLSVGADADFLLYDFSCFEDWVADPGTVLPTGVWLGGECRAARVL